MRVDDELGETPAAGNAGRRKAPPRQMYNSNVGRIRRSLIPTPRVAAALWIVLAVIVWNAVFDYQIVVAGRLYVHAAAAAAQAGSSWERVDDWMRPAIVRGLWLASAAAGAILLAGLLSVRFAMGASSPNSAEALGKA
jgi:hypothetical protein